jgi:integrase
MMFFTGGIKTSKIFGTHRRYKKRKLQAESQEAHQSTSRWRAALSRFSSALGGVTIIELAILYTGTRQLSAQYGANLCRTAQRAKAWGITTDNITDQLVNKFILQLSTHVSLNTRANIRRELLTLWRYGYETEVIKTPPKLVAKIFVPNEPVEAWSLNQLQHILAIAKKDKTKIGGVTQMRICDYMPCWIRLGYESALRHADILSLTAKDFRNGCVSKVANKTRKSLTRRIEEETEVLARELIARSNNGTVFLWFLTRRRSFTSMKSFLERHEIPGSGKFLRRSCATAIANDSPSKASAYLQHSSQKLLAHYVDESLLDVPEGPPPIS